MKRAGVCFGFVFVCLGAWAGCTGPGPTDAGASDISSSGDPPLRDVPRFDVPAEDAFVVSDVPDLDAPTDVASGCDGGGAPERCNGVDDDCDGERDEGCSCLPDAPVAIDDGFHMSLAISTSGSLATASQDFATGALSIRRYAGSFAPLGDVTTLVMDDTRPPNDLVLFALGDDFGAVWRQWPSSTLPSDDAFFARLAGGVRDVGPLDLSPSLGALGHSVAPFGAGFVVARNEGGTLAGVAVRIVDRDGVVLEGPHPLAEERSVAYTGVGVIGTTVGVAYQSTGPADGELHFARFDASAMPIGPSIVVAPSGSRPHVAAQASGWGIVWDDAAGISFAAVAADGSIRVAPRVILPGAGANGLAIAADGAGGWGVVARAGAGTQFLLLDGTGATAGEAELAGYFVDGQGALAHDGARFVAAVFGSGSALWVPCETR